MASYNTGHMPRMRHSTPRGIPNGNAQRTQPSSMHMGTSPHTNPMQYPSPQQGQLTSQYPPQQMVYPGAVMQQPGQPMNFPGHHMGYAQQPQYIIYQPSTSPANNMYYPHAQQQPPNMSQGGPMPTQPQGQQGVSTRPPSNPGMGSVPQPQPVMSTSMQSSGGYGNPPPQMSFMPQQPMQPQTGLMRQPPVPQQPPQQPQPLQKRVRKPLAIIDPDSNEVINKETLTTDSSQTSTPSSSDRNTPVPQAEQQQVIVSSAVTSSVASTPVIVPKPAQHSTQINTQAERPSAGNSPATVPADKSTGDDIKNQFKAMVQSKISSSSTAVDSTSPAAAVNGDVVKPVEEVKKPEADKPKPTEVKKEQDKTVSSTTPDVKQAPAAAVATEPKTVTPTPDVVASKEAAPVVETKPAAPKVTEPASAAVAAEKAVAQGPAEVDVKPVEKKATVEVEKVKPVDKVDSAVTESKQSEPEPAKPAEEVEPSPEPAVVKTEQAPVAAAVESEPKTKPKVTIESVKLPSDTQLMPPPAAPTPTTPTTDDKENSPAPPSQRQSSMDLPAPTSSMIKSKSMAADMSKLPTYKYREDISQPLNPEAKKVYDREFLMGLQKSELSKQKPEGLPILADILLNKPDFHKSLSFNRKDLTPDFFKPLSSPRNSMNRGRGGNSVEGRNPGRDGRDGRGRGQIKIEFQRADVKLHKSDNAWNPKAAKAMEDLSEEDKAHEELLKTFRGMLNKITPQKFQAILKKILALPVKSERDLDGAMNLVFEKAIAEPGFSVTYANLCQNLAKEFKVPTEKDPTVEVSFRKLLLVRCQREFEKSADDDEQMIAKTAALENASAEEKPKLEEEFESFCTKARRRKLGNIRFIGELFKLQMLVPKIMHDCVVSLLKGTDEESLECLCRLLTTIGKELDTEKAKPRTDQYFNEMRKIVNNQAHKKVSARIKFALQDVIELRESNWKPRRENNNPKTIKEIHAEAALEAHEKQMMIDKGLPSRPSQGRNQGPPRGRQHDDPGWNQVGSGVMKSQRIDPSKLKLTKQSFGDSDGVQLGPARGFGGNWGKGSSGSGKNTPPQQQEERPSTPTNRFSALQGGSDRDRDERSRSGQRLPTGRSSMGRGQMVQRGSNSRNMTPRGSMEKERSNALASARQLSRPGGSRGPSRENSVEGRSMRPPSLTRNAPAAKAAPASIKPLSRDEWENKMKSTIDEYLHNKDMKEAVDCIRELGEQPEKELITECSVNHVLERSQAARKATGLMLAELIKHELLPLDKHIKGLSAVLEFADDLAIDIPNVWQYFGELIAPTFISGGIKLDKIEALCTPLLPIGKSATLAAAILEEASHNLGHVELSRRWNACNLKWSSFLSEEENEQEFIKSHKLEYTTATSSEHSPATRQTSSEDIATMLNKLLVIDSAPNEAVFDWVDANLSADKCQQQSFIRSLTMAVTEACLEKSGTSLSKEKLRSRGPILLRYYDSNSSSGLFALSALEDLMDKLQHPANLLNDIFDAYIDDDLIADESFFEWEKTSKNGIAVRSVTQFLKWLREEGD